MVDIRKDNITPKDERSERREEVSSDHMFEHFVQISNRTNWQIHERSRNVKWYLGRS